MTRSRRSFLFATSAFAVAAIAAVAGCKLFASPPDDLDLRTSKPSAQGRYVVALAPEGAEIPMGSLHAWTVDVRTAQGQPVDGAAISIDGGMPQHGHGLPTKPAATRTLGEGRYLIEGMKFNMPGWWVLDIGIEGGAGTDTITFNIIL